MAITYNLPIGSWYFDTTSEWTLDYPPLFAAFEFLLALIAHLLNLGDALDLTQKPIRTESIVIYQKLTVIFSDIVYYYAVYKLCRTLKPLVPRSNPSKRKAKDEHQVDKLPELADQNLLDAFYRPDETTCIALLLLLQPGLLIVDHIHFQYNGFLSGIFLLSVAEIIACNYASGSLWFSVLLNFKHIYLYCAPAFGMYLLAAYCVSSVPNRNRLLSFLSRTTKLGLVVVLVFVIVYLPFADPTTLKQIISRLFPFKRGLTHAYWAPNFWSLYNSADKILATIYKRSMPVKFDLDSISGVKPVSSTSGLVQEYEHLYLPSIKPLTTFSLVAALTVPLVIKFLSAVSRPSPSLFLKGVTIAAFTSFMFGWHVHEKAILVVLLPMIPASFLDPNLKPALLRLTLAGTYSLFPLLFRPAEYLTKVTLLLAYYLYASSKIQSLRPLMTAHDEGSSITEGGRQRGLVVAQLSRLYTLFDTLLVLAVVMVELYVSFVHGHLDYQWNPIARLNKLAFLPLLLTSSLSAVGITFTYLELYYDFLRSVKAIAQH